MVASVQVDTGAGNSGPSFLAAQGGRWTAAEASERDDAGRGTNDHNLHCCCDCDDREQQSDRYHELSSWDYVCSNTKANRVPK